MCIIEPTEAHTLGPIQILCFGKPNDWRLKDRENEVLPKLAPFAFERNITTIFAPNPVDFNAEICDPVALQQVFTYSDEHGKTVELRRGVKVEGTYFFRGQGFVMPTGDCMTVVIYNPHTDFCFAAHAGRESVYDKGFLQGKPPRGFPSVVDTLMTACPSESRPFLKVWVGCGIAAINSPHPFNHPQFGEHNKKMLAALKQGPLPFKPEMGYISLKKVIKQQLISYGVDPDNIACDSVNTYADSTSDNEFRWWSHRRWNDSNQEGVNGRNAVLVLFPG